MDAADKETIRITAIDSLKSCWRDGQTTSFNSSRVVDIKPFLFEGSISCSEEFGSSVLLGDELVTWLKANKSPAEIQK